VLRQGSIVPKSGMPAPTAPVTPAATSLDHSEEDATTSLYRAAIGLVNVDYYLPIFTRFEAVSRISPSWNSAASLYTLNWLLFRRLWLAAGLYGSLVLGVALVWFLWPEALDLSVLLVLGVLSVVVPGIYGNALLHQACRQKMAHALTVNTTLAQACSMLQREASSRRHFLWLALLNGALLCAALAAYLLWPAAGKTPLTAPPRVEASNQAAGRVSESASAPAAVASAVLAIPPVEAASVPQTAASTSGGAAEAAPVVAAAAEVPTPAPLAAPVAIVPASTASDPVPVQALRKDAAKDVAVPARAPTSTHHFAINVGLFAKDANAQKVHTQLLAAGLPVYTQGLQTSKGKLTRVRVGPFKSQREADAAAGQIHALKLDAVVFEQ
jgi:cell division septation protein DedD